MTRGEYVRRIRDTLVDQANDIAQRRRLDRWFQEHVERLEVSVSVEKPISAHYRGATEENMQYQMDKIAKLIVKQLIASGKIHTEQKEDEYSTIRTLTFLVVKQADR